LRQELESTLAAKILATPMETEKKRGKEKRRGEGEV